MIRRWIVPCTFSNHSARCNLIESRLDWWMNERMNDKTGKQSAITDDGTERERRIIMWFITLISIDRLEESNWVNCGSEGQWQADSIRNKINIRTKACVYQQIWGICFNNITLFVSIGLLFIWIMIILMHLIVAQFDPYRIQLIIIWELIKVFISSYPFFYFVPYGVTVKVNKREI